MKITLCMFSSSFNLNCCLLKLISFIREVSLSSLRARSVVVSMVIARKPKVPGLSPTASYMQR